MSAFVTIPTPMTDRECLLLALADLGHGPGQVDVHETPVVMDPTWGAASTRAHVVLRAGGHPVVGFLETPAGFQVHRRGTPGFGGDWLKTLRARHDAHLAAKDARIVEEKRRALVEAQTVAIKEAARRQGYAVRESREGGGVRLVMTRRL